MVLERIDIDCEKPTKDGLYLIETISTIKLPITRRPVRFESNLTITKNEKGELKHTWNISNQKVVAWFREIN